MFNSFIDAEKILKQAQIQEGALVGDFGAGVGEYSLIASKYVGSRGRVYALEVQKDLLLKLKTDAERNHIRNIDVLWVDLEDENGSKLSSFLLDYAIVVNTLFQIEYKEKFLKEVKRVLKPEGKIIFVDWKDSFGMTGPLPEQIIQKEKAINIFEQAGFVFSRDIDAGDLHYGIIFGKS